MPANHVRVEAIDDVTVVTMDRPPANALDLGFALELESAFARLQTEDRSAIVLTGTGEFFSAGLDLKIVPGYSNEDQREMILTLGRMVGALYACPRPTVAAVNGHAVAAGTLLALACDYRVGTRGTFRFGLTGAKAGIPYPVAAQAIIESELDPATRRIMLLGAEQFGPDVALARGIVDELVDHGDAGGRAVELAHARAALPRDAYGKIKLQLRAPALQRIREANESGEDPFLQSWMTAESAAASAGVLDRHPPGSKASGQQ